jgi:hypothetical protein
MSDQRQALSRSGARIVRLAATGANQRITWILAALVFGINAVMSGLRGDLWLTILETATAMLAVAASTAIISDK